MLPYVAHVYTMTKYQDVVERAVRLAEHRADPEPSAVLVAGARTSRRRQFFALRRGEHGHAHSRAH